MLGLWNNFVSELLDLVIEHELKLIKLLYLLSQLLNLLIFVLNGKLSFMKLILETFNDVSFSVCIVDLFLKLSILLKNLLIESLLLSFFEKLLVLDKLQIGLLFHTLVNLSCKFLFILLLDQLNVFPCVILDLLPLCFVIFDHCVDGL